MEYEGRRAFALGQAAIQRELKEKFAGLWKKAFEDRDRECAVEKERVDDVGGHGVKDRDTFARAAEEAEDEEWKEAEDFEEAEEEEDEEDLHEQTSLSEHQVDETEWSDGDEDNFTDASDFLDHDERDIGLDDTWDHKDVLEEEQDTGYDSADRHVDRDGTVGHSDDLVIAEDLQLDDPWM
ncbi:hypothetical protein VNI00_014881 [Paramarasmius palmivorus]|uniref:Uncharacterized protein n=1 Tax=Paramarasmius palmivorus TaxID=297713 RepID=A0AAW0BLY1_9AGAR